MRTFAFVFVAFMAFVVFVCAAPITPAAPTLQRRAEQYRLQGLKEVCVLSHIDTCLLY
jgi:hypothetical protein